MANKQIAYRRMHNQRIAWTQHAAPLEAVQRLGAMQAQDYYQVLWAIGSRMGTAKVAEVKQAIADREIVLTWAMRGTLHAMPAEDAHGIVSLLKPRFLSVIRRHLEQAAFDSVQIEQGERVVYEALNIHKRMTRQSLMQALEEAGVSTADGRGYQLLRYLAQDGLICLASMEDKQQTFALMEEWIPEVRPYSAEDALTRLTKSYFTGHGPASVQDFAWWSGLTLTQARNGIEAAQEDLTLEKFDGLEYWSGRDDGADNRESASDKPPEVRLLAGFDEYLLGYKDRSAVLNKEYASLISGKNGVFAPLLVVDGEIAGVWKRTIQKEGIEISVRPFEKLGCEERSLIEAAQQYVGFMDMTLSGLTVEKI